MKPPRREFLLAAGGLAELEALGRAWEAAGEGHGTRLLQEGAGELAALDSFDGLLHAEGLTLLWEEGRLVLSERATATELALAPWPELRGPIRAAALPPGRLRETLAPVLELRALLPLARLPSRRRTLELLAGEEKVVARVRLERAGRLPPRLRVLPLRGYESAAGRAAALVAALPGASVAELSLGDAAIAQTGHPPEGVRARVEVEIPRGERADVAAARVLAALLDVIEANLEGTLGDTDPEFLHDLRVSVRRSRAVLRELAGVFPPGALAHFRGELKWLQGATGEARDLDVHVEAFAAIAQLVPEPLRSELGPLLDALRARRRRAHEAMGVELRSRRMRILLEGWRQQLERLPSEPADERPAARDAVEEVVARRIRRVYRRMVRMGRAIDAGSPAEDLHELRKKGKELRYLLELFGPLFPHEVVTPMVKRLKALQDVLGHHQDREVQQAILQDLREDVAAAPGGAGALLGMGALLIRLREQEAEARADFAERFAAFAAKRQRKLVRRTFS